MNPIPELLEDEVELVAFANAQNGVQLQLTGIHAAECVAQVLLVGYPVDYPVIARVRVEHDARTWTFDLPVDSPRRLVLIDRSFPDSVLYAPNQQPPRNTLPLLQGGALVDAENVLRRARLAEFTDEQLMLQHASAIEPLRWDEAEALRDELTERGWIYDYKFSDFIDCAEWNARHGDSRRIPCDEE